MTAPRSLQFEGFTLDLDRLCLHGPLGGVNLRRKSFDVLRHLVEHAGRVVNKEELIRAVWPDVTVSDESLTQCISEVRRALGDEGPRIIKTVARRGYLVDIPVLVRPSPLPGPSSPTVGAGGDPQDAPPDSPAASPRLAVASRQGTPPAQQESYPARFFVTGVALAAGLAILTSLAWTSFGAGPSSTRTMLAKPTIAIMPFAASGAVDRQRSFAAGISAEIRSELARTFRGFELVIRPGSEDPEPSRWAKMPLAQSGARYVVNGATWIDMGGQLVNMRPVETETNREIWAESFDVDFASGAFNRTAARIARSLVIQIQTVESRLPLPANPEAGHYALLGRAIYEAERGAESSHKAQALFKKALSLDANSVPALQGFATIAVTQALNAWIPAEQRLSALVDASEAVDRSIKLDPRNAAGHAIRGVIFRALGELDKGIASLEYAVSLNPNLYGAHGELAGIKIDAGQALESLRHIEEALQLAPAEPNAQNLYFYAGKAALFVADDPAAVKWFLKARQANPAYTIVALWLAAAYVGMGEEQAARASLAEYLREQPRFSIEGFKRFVPMPNPVAAKQHERIMDAWRRLGIPETSPP